MQLDGVQAVEGALVSRDKVEMALHVNDRPGITWLRVITVQLKHVYTFTYGRVNLQFKLCLKYYAGNMFM